MSHDNGDVRAAPPEHLIGADPYVQRHIFER
jgi:hypothetical protein